MREPSAIVTSYDREMQARPQLDKHSKGTRTMDTGIRSQIGTEATAVVRAAVTAGPQSEPDSAD